MKLEPRVLYRAKVKNVAFGRIPTDRLVEILASGRLCGVLLEEEISQTHSNTESGRQGLGPDIILTDRPDSKVQMKTYKAAGDAVYQRGPDRGKKKADRANIWTTKSGLWDRWSEATPAQKKEAKEYIRSYDHFLYVDIGGMLELAYTYVMIPSTTVADLLVDSAWISETAILSQVESEVEVGAGGQSG